MGAVDLASTLTLKQQLARCVAERLLPAPSAEAKADTSSSATAAEQSLADSLISGKRAIALEVYTYSTLPQVGL
jgi:hypothetical protein